MQMRTPRVKLIIVAALSTPRPVLGSSRWSGKADRYILSTGNSRRKSLALRSSVAALLLGARATTRKISRIKGSAREDELESAVPVSWRQAGFDGRQW